MNKVLNILILDDALYPLSYAYMQELFGRHLVKRGHHVTWLLLSRRIAKVGESKKFGLTDVVLAPTRNSENRYVQLFANRIYFKQIMSSYLMPRVIREKNIDIVFVRNYVRAGLDAYRVCRKKKVPFVYYLGYPQLESHLLSARRGFRQPRILDEVFALVGIPLRNWVTRNADFVFTMSDYWREQLIKELMIPSDRVGSLPAAFDTSIDPKTVDGTKVRRKFSLNNHPTVFYMGAIRPPRNTSILVDMMSEIIKRIPEVRLMILPGHGEEKRVPALAQRFAEKGIERNVVFAQPVPYWEVRNYIAASHVGVSPIEPIPLYNVSSPYKFIEMLGMGCPVVASNTPEQKHILSQTKAGTCVKYHASAFSEAVVRILSHPEEAQAMGKRGRSFVKEERSYNVLADRIENVFLHLTSKGKNIYHE